MRCYPQKKRGISILFYLVCIIAGLTSVSFASDKRTNKLYELYNSTSTPKIYKQILKHHIDRRERIEKLRANAKLSAKKRALSAPAVVKTAGISAVPPLAAEPEFKLGEVYCYPNPAKKTNPTFHMEAGLADKVELKVYDTAGDLVHETVLTGMPQVINDGQGSQYAYEYLWDTKNAGSGVYIFSMTAKKGDKTLRKTGRCAVIK